MKKIIDGKIYDTEKAELIESDRYSNSGDFHHTFKCLYRTKSDKYFFYGGGGPMSEYAVSLGNNETGGSEDIWLPGRGNDVISWLSKINPDKAIKMFPSCFKEA